MKTKQHTIDYWVEHLKLNPHPEGGFYKETYRSKEAIHPSYNKSASRNLATGIYFLITAGNFSAFHRIKSDEMWHFYTGSPLVVHVITPDGEYSTLHIGLDLEKGQTPQAIVPAGAWFASESSGEYSLVGCTVSPGFDFEDFELANKERLTETFPTYSATIERLTKG
jgi:predicted cupin superfamily sugar epimerase